MKRIKLFPLLKQAAGWITVFALVSVLMVWQFSYKSAAAGIVSKGTTTEDSIAVSCFVADSLGNPNNLAADTFFVVTIGPQGDSIYGAIGVPSNAAFTGELDSLTVGAIGKLYVYTNAISVIDGAGDVGTYELRFCVKKNSPKYVTCAKTEFQIVDTTLNYKLNQLAEILDSLKAAATLADIEAEITGSQSYFSNLLQNPGFDDSATASTYNFWTPSVTGTANSRFSSLSPGRIGPYTSRFETNAAVDTARFRSKPIHVGTSGAYEYGGYFDYGSLEITDSVWIGITAPETDAFTDSLGMGRATGTTGWSTWTKKVWISAGNYQFYARLPGDADIDVGYLDNTFLTRIPTDSAGLSLWTTAQRDSVLARLLDLGDSLRIITDSLKNMHNWIANQGTLANMGLYDGAYYDTTAVILYPLGQVPKDSARVYQVTGGWAGVWTYRATIKYSIKNRSISTSNVIDTIRFARP